MGHIVPCIMRERSIVVKKSALTNLADQMTALLPALRRYARSLTGTQASGDAIAIATFEAVLADRSIISNAPSVEIGLFGECHRVWTAKGAQAGLLEDPLFARAQVHLNKLTPLSREALLLHAVEDFSAQDIAQILGLDRADAAEELLQTGLAELKAATAGRILVIEDEAMIAIDLRDILEGMGHTVTGAATTHQEAVEMAADDRPDLILADIKLADGSLGTDAVTEILQGAAGIPVIFITAYPELLLTGERPEPVFLIPKPYQSIKIVSAVSQAMFFADAGEIIL